jgi:hypothetical protein
VVEAEASIVDDNGLLAVQLEARLWFGLVRVVVQHGPHADGNSNALPAADRAASSGSEQSLALLAL